MKVKTIVNNCISDVINSKAFNKIFVYGSDNLELEKLIYNLTSSPIIGGDVDFCNVLLGKYFSNNDDLELSEEIYKDFELDTNCALSDVEKLSLAIIYKSFRPKQNNEHNKRIFNNITKNKEKLISKINNQINKITFLLNEFKECKLEGFIKDISDKDLLIIDNRSHNFVNDKSIEQLYDLNISFVIISKKDLTNIKQNQILKSQNLNIYSNIDIKIKLISTNAKNNIIQKSFNIFENENIEDVEIKQLISNQFNALRQKYISKQIHYFGTPKVCYGLFVDDKLFGVFGLTNDYRNKPPKEIEQPCIYLLSDFVTNSNIRKLSKLVLYCVLSKEVKLLAERLLNKEIKTIYTNVFTKNMSSIKYRDLFILQGRKQMQDGSYNLTYFSQMGKWSLKEGLELWKQKL